MAALVVANAGASSTGQANDCGATLDAHAVVLGPCRPCSGLVWQLVAPVLTSFVMASKILDRSIRATCFAYRLAAHSASSRSVIATPVGFARLSLAIPLAGCSCSRHRHDNPLQLDWSIFVHAAVLGVLNGVTAPTRTLPGHGAFRDLPTGDGSLRMVASYGHIGVQFSDRSCAWNNAARS